MKVTVRDGVGERMTRSPAPRVRIQSEAGTMHETLCSEGRLVTERERRAVIGENTGDEVIRMVNIAIRVDDARIIRETM